MFQNTGKLYVVATPIGNLDDISKRACSVLSQVAWVAAEDTRHSGSLFQHLGITTPLIAFHDHNERIRAVNLIERILQGESGALISDAGTPLISDPGFSLVALAHEKGVTVVPIPGACAAITGLSASGLPTDKFLFEGFLAAKPQARRKRLTSLAKFPHTLIFYEAPHRILAFIEDACEIFSKQRKVVLGRELTKKFESIYVGDCEKILIALQRGEIPLKGEFVVLVEGFGVSENIENESEIEIEKKRILEILLAEMPLKQAVGIAVKLSGLPKNALYDCAMKLQKK